MSVADLSDVRMYYEVSGCGPCLLMIPGLGSTSRSWDPVRGELEKHFTLITIDNRGVGKSEPKRPPNSLRDYSADLVELIDYLQLDHVNVLGLSLGGIIAQRFAVEHAARMRRLVLMSCTHKFGPYLKEIATLIGVTLKGFSKDSFTRTLALLGAGPAFFDADPQRMQRAVEQAEANGVPRADVLRQLKCLLASGPEAADDELLIRCPTLVMAGEYDSIIPSYYAKRMAGVIRDSEFVLVENAGHNPLLECPETVIETMREFLHRPDAEAGERAGGRLGFV